MNNLTIKMPERLKVVAQKKAKCDGVTFKAYNDGKLGFGLFHADDEITASFDVSTKEGKRACFASFKALAKGRKLFGCGYWLA
ncbi:MAG: hypothetical protein WC873_02760 [Candidatus Gracilibacteria bacterium]